MILAPLFTDFNITVKAKLSVIFRIKRLLYVEKNVVFDVYFSYFLPNEQ